MYPGYPILASIIAQGRQNLLATIAVNSRDSAVAKFSASFDMALVFESLTLTLACQAALQIFDDRGHKRYYYMELCF